jgi:hypothetical protein
MASVVTDYPAAWNDYCRRWWTWMLGWLGPLPAELLVGVPLTKLTGSNAPFLIIAVAGMVCFLIGGTRTIYWRCPRCGKSFHHKWGYTNTFARNCLHCGLPKR